MSELLIFTRTMGESYLEACLQRIREHTTEPHRLLVWVNGAGRATADLVGRYTDDVIVTTRNKGCVATCGHVLLYEDYAELVRLSCAIMVAPGWIEALRAPFRQHAGVGLTGMRSDFGRYRTPPGQTEECDPSNLPDHLIMTTRVAVDRVGAMSPSFHQYGHEITEHHARVWRAGLRVFAVETGCHRYQARHDGRDAVPGRDELVARNQAVWQRCADKGYRGYDWWRSDL